VAVTLFFYSDKQTLGEESEKKEAVGARSHRTAAPLHRAQDGFHWRSVA
jgi:hypothetical protein